jgi:hypothetical protein
METENLRQQLIIRQQDDHLDDLHLSVTRIGEMGLSIHTELKEQVCANLKPNKRRVG